MKKLKGACLAAAAEYHLRRIIRLRNLGVRLLEAGEALDSERMIKLNDRLSRHSLGFTECEQRLKKQT